MDPHQFALAPRLRRAGLVLMLMLALMLALCPPAFAAKPMDRTQALSALAAADAQQRAAAIERLAQIGRMADAERVAERLRDEDAEVRDAAGAALWQIWSRSGDAAIDRRLARGVQQLQTGDLQSALATFDDIVRRKPAFAEGWNKRATVRFLLGEDEASLRDCDEVLRRNPRHFGALSGMAQIHLRRGNPAQALQAFERALQANPNLEGGPEFLQLLQEAVRQRGGQTT